MYMATPCGYNAGFPAGMPQDHSPQRRSPMKAPCRGLLLASCLSLLSGASAVYSVAAELPENLAPKAKVSASSEHNEQYLAKFAVDGRIPPPGSTSADLGAAWCVLKAQSGDQAEFCLEWPEPVEVSEVIYFGRTSWFISECWKDYEVYAEPAPGAS